MRTTITLDDDTAALVRQAMADRGLTFKDAVNEAIRAGLSGGGVAAPIGETFAMGVPAVSVDKALQLAGELEDDELLRRMQVGK